MSVSSYASRLLRPIVGAGLIAVLLTGCSGSNAPSDAVPELKTRLSAIDDALASEDYERARQQIARLVDATIDARREGELDSARAEPILAAAASLATALPVSREEPPPAEPDPAEPESDSEDGEDSEEREKQQKELEKKRKELEKKREERQKKLEEEQKKREKEQEKAEREDSDEDGS